MKKKFMTILAIVSFGVSIVLFANKETDAKIETTRYSSPKATPQGSNILIAYFTFPESDGVDASTGASKIIVDNKLYGSTEYVAKVISETTGGDLFQIKTKHTYPINNHKKLIDYAKEEAKSKTYPKMTTAISNFAEYDVVFVGYPNWWYDMPMVIYTLFNEYDFKGKTIIPFCTHGGSGFSQSVKTISDMEKDAKVIKGLSISRDNVSTSRNGIIKWLKAKDWDTNSKNK